MVKKSFVEFCTGIAFPDGKPAGHEIARYEVKLSCNGERTHIAWFLSEDLAVDYCNYLNSKSNVITHFYYVSTCVLTGF